MLDKSKTMIAGLGLAAALAAGPAAAQTDKVALAVSSTSLTFAAVYIAEDAGFFKREGLEVEVRELVGVASVNAVIGGSMDFMVPTGSTVLRAVGQGQSLLAIANILDKPNVELVMSKKAAEEAGITEKSTFEERGMALKGKNVGIQGVGSVIDVTVRAIARKAGLNPDEDMTISPMGPPAMPAALKAGTIDAYATSLPWTTMSVLSGDAITLVSGPTGGLSEYVPFAYNILTTRRELCEKQPQICEKMVRAFASSVEMIKKEPDKALDLMKKRFSKMDPKLLEAAWPTVAAAHADDITVTEEALKNALRLDVDAGLSADTDLDLSKVYTDKFIP